jgi:hypothetical protein
VPISGVAELERVDDCRAFLDAGSCTISTTS